MSRRDLLRMCDAIKTDPAVLDSLVTFERTPGFTSALLREAERLDLSVSTVDVERALDDALREWRSRWV